MRTTDPGDAARIELLLAEPRLPAIKLVWASLAAQADKEGWPAGRFRGLSFPGIAPGETYVYRFPVHQSGTYWYHSHSNYQEQTGVYGPIVIDPKAGYPQPFDRDYVVFLSDWSDTSPDTIVSNLKFQSDYYNFHQRTAGTFFEDVAQKGFAATVADRLEWGRMRMSPTDILDVSGATYTYLINGHPPGANWTALFRPGERLRLRFINGSSMSIFDVRIDGLPMTVVQADGNDVMPVTVDEFRISVAETYDVIVHPKGDRAYTLFVQAEDRTGYARGTLAPRPGMAAAIPPMDPRPLRTMTDMGMGGMDHGSMPGTSMDHGSMPSMLIGTEHYAAHCAVCHGAPGVPKGDIGRGLNPPPPDLAKNAPLYNPAELFWIVKHGIKMTGMPAWSDHSDEELWATVAFLEKLPAMSEQEYAGLVMASMAHGGHHDHGAGDHDSIHPDRAKSP
jgi:CopA family copper-resistance protein